jgi:formiminoglutamase
MDLTLFFNPVQESLISTQNVASLARSLRIYVHKMPDYKDAHLAILGVPEERGAGKNSGTLHAPDEIRKKLYSLKRSNVTYRVVDLGNLKPGHDLQETYTRLSEVCRILLEHNVLPVILGGSHDLTYGQYTAYEQLDKLVSLLNIDAFLDLEQDSEASPSSSHLQKILLYEPNFLFSYTHLAYQSYLIDPDSVATLEKLYFEAFRIGQMRTNLQDIEPVIRQADMLSFDVTAIRSADAPGNIHAQPFGLTGEEACQICWYAGLNEKLSSIGFYEYNPLLDDASCKTASVIATMVWYFIEGYYHRKSEQNFRSNDFLKYVVAMPAHPETIIFYKSKRTEKWWMEIPYPEGLERYARNSIVPCSYTDYQTATRGEVPERYIQTIARLS